MNTQSLETELEGIQKRFNRTYGNQATCDITTRSLVIMSIANMGAIIKKMKRNRNRPETRDQILLLKRMRNVINRTFDQVEKSITERRIHETEIKIAM